ncbi:hypothetical protein [Flavobacterium succinicans]|uniref:Lipoprotein n=1 Tax=Flavobacterium succinicans TaxID=29536 RepID=A0A199XUN5_9FLAO|nr:hypothetical protein [Flavobacterium succinicans]OAZ05132.1 hypothetical protein FLB_09840 [Flavobacterium succinicans]
MKKHFYFISSILYISILLSCSNSKIQNYNSSKNIQSKQDSLAFELCQMYGLDQGIRLSEGFKDKSKFIQNIDTLNFKKVVAFVKANGFPNKTLLGEKNFNYECVQGSFGAILLHNPHRLVNEQIYFDLFLNEVKKGNFKPDFFAAVLDKYYWTISKNKKNRRVFYGSAFGKPCLQTKEATNKARIEIGLKALKDDEFVDCAGEELNMPIVRT